MKTNGNSPVQTEAPVAVYDVVQIHPQFVNEDLRGAFALVKEVRTWGVVAHVPWGKDKIVPVRLQTQDFARIGVAEWGR